jgi:hypothetical protein
VPAPPIRRSARSPPAGARPTDASLA